MGLFKDGFITLIFYFLYRISSDLNVALNELDIGFFSWVIVLLEAICLYALMYFSSRFFYPIFHGPPKKEGGSPIDRDH